MLPVNHESNVGQIESHAESIGTDDDSHGRLGAARELAQQYVAVVSRTEFGVEEGKLHAQRPKAVLELLSRVDCRHEQHGTTMRHDPEKVRDQRIPHLVFHIRQTDELDVRPVHSCHHYAGVWYSERFQNALLALRSGCGSERQHRWTPKCLANCAQPTVVRAEVFSPTIDSVRFVDDQVGRPSTHDLVQFSLTNDSRIEALRRAVQELDGAIP